MTIKLQKLAPTVLLAAVSVTLLALPTQGWANDPRVNNTIIVKKHKRFEHRNPSRGYGPSHYGRGQIYNDNNPRSGFGNRSNPYGYGYDYRGRRVPNHYSDRIPRGYRPHLNPYGYGNAYPDQSSLRHHSDRNPRGYRLNRREFGYDPRYQNPGNNRSPHVERRRFGLGGNYRNR